MSGYDASGVDDDRVAQAARRIVRQYHLEQSDRSEDSAADAASRDVAGAPDNISTLRLALDDMGLKVEHLQRLIVNREALFMATLERLDRNLAKTDGLVDALSADVARIDSRPVIEHAAILEDQRGAAASLTQEWAGMMALGRALLDEVRELHAATTAAAIAAPPGQVGGGPVTR